MASGRDGGAWSLIDCSSPERRKNRVKTTFPVRDIGTVPARSMISAGTDARDAASTFPLPGLSLILGFQQLLVVAIPRMKPPSNIDFMGGGGFDRDSGADPQLSLYL